MNETETRCSQLKFQQVHPAKVRSITVTATTKVGTINTERTARTATTMTTTTTKSFRRRIGTDLSGGRINLRRRKLSGVLTNFSRRSPTKIYGQSMRLDLKKYIFWLSPFYIRLLIFSTHFPINQVYIQPLSTYTGIRTHVFTNVNHKPSYSDSRSVFKEMKKTEWKDKQTIF